MHQPAALSEDQQLGVEEPGLVAHSRQQLAHDVAADRLEAALSIAELRAQTSRSSRL